MVKEKVKTQKQILVENGYITANDAARVLGISRPRMYQMLESKAIEGIEIGVGDHKRQYVRKQDLIDKLGPDAARVLGLR